MAQQKGSPSFGKKVGKIGLYILLAALAWALLQRFDLDPFAVIGWAWNKIWGFINYLSDKFLDNGTFQDVTKSPGIISYIGSYFTLYIR